MNARRKDLVVLVADKNMESTVRGLLPRSESLEMRNIACNDGFRNRTHEGGLSMSRKQLLAGLVVLGALAVICDRGRFSATARQPGESGNAANTDIAVLDVARVFKQNQRFARDVAELKKEVGHLDVEFRLRGKEVERLQEQLAGSPSGSPERKKLGDELIDKKARIQADVEKQKAQLQQRETLLYRDVYLRVAELTAEYAKEHGLRLVVRFNSGSIESTDRKAVLEAVNRGVVFHDNLDISDAIIERLNAQDETSSDSATSG